MNWTEQIEHYGELGAHALAHIAAEAAWHEWIEGGATHGQR